LAPEVGRRRADQAVAGHEPVVQERQRLVRGKRGEPQRQPRDLHGCRVQIDAEQTPLRDLASKRDALRCAHVGSVPPAITNQCLLGRRGQLRARRDQERAAAHRRIEDAQAQDVVRASAGEKRPQRLTDHTGGQRARRVERTGGFAKVSRSRQPAGVGLVVEDLLVDGPKLLDVQVAIDDALLSGMSIRRRGADRQHRLRHHPIVDRLSIEGAGAGRREQASVERGDFQLPGGAAGVREPRDGVDGAPDAPVPASGDQGRDNRIDRVAVPVDGMPDRNQPARLGEEQEQDAIQHGERLLDEKLEADVTASAAERAQQQFKRFEHPAAERLADRDSMPRARVHGAIDEPR
jgi:hypothetical protein